MASTFKQLSSCVLPYGIVGPIKSKLNNSSKELPLEMRKAMIIYKVIAGRFHITLENI